MRVVYIDTALPDLQWWRRYYTRVFPEGRRKAGARFLEVIAALQANPHIGHVADEPGVLEFVIRRTPFSVVYRVNGDVIEILRIWDNRQQRQDADAESLSPFVRSPMSP